jgi:Cof subfamily protein (haloacid dehalogenase superfamily)
MCVSISQADNENADVKIDEVTPTVRLIAVDIDGTLIDSTLEIPAANLNALRRAHQAGIHVVLVTGRRHRFAMPVAEQLGFEFCLISSNGAITRSTQGTLHHADMLPKATAHKLCRHMAEFSGCTVLTFDKDERGAIVVERTDELGSNIQRWIDKNRTYIEEVSPITSALVCDPVQAMFCGTIERMRPAEVRLRNGALAGEINVLKTQYDHRDLCILDVLKHGCSKGSAVARWAAHLGISRAEVMAIGDNYNDVEMLEFAGYPVIMANASEDLRQRGWQVTLHHEECGVAAAVEEVLAGALR